ncbi:hypothetical protein DVH24_025827 [Malus domestica]|uniref:Uncharacterized protein n=1 Tax=Malus domestica TaxID=3750 RepID=A0A498KHP8_MALDO|nr:hypothetical protein DVH24_025827 [Malus domestica]
MPKKEQCIGSHGCCSSTCNRSLFLLSDISSNTWCAAPRGRTSSSKGSHQQLQGTSKVISMASKGSCDPIDPTVAPPLIII